MAGRSDLLQKSIAQSQSVQEGLESLLQSLAEIERNLQKEDIATFSSTSIQESLATNMVSTFSPPPHLLPTSTTKEGTISLQRRGQFEP